MHWLTNAAQSAGWHAATPVKLPSGTALPDAWRAVAQAYGVTDAELARAVATLFRLHPADLLSIDGRAVKLVPEKLARKYAVLALRESHNEIVVATSDPTDYDAEQAVRFTAGRRVVLQVADPASLQDAIDARYAPERAMETLLQSVDDRLAEQVQVVEEAGPEQVASRDTEAAPVVKLTNMILHAAVAAEASDIHIEPGRGAGVVRFRVDGVLRQYMQMPLTALNRVVSRVKVLGRLDIADRLRPQDGRTRLSIANRTFDMRISTVPTRDAEKAVIRILNPEASRSVAEIGLEPSDLTRLKHLLSHREGMVVVTGPTGSGKTTTLYGGIRELAGGTVNIMTVEDPVEYELPGVTQIQIDPKRSVTFASALRAILRQDPDVVFVGEIRDPETAQVALQASMTGHLVLATLHTNDVVGIVQRLVDLGLDRASIAASLRGGVGQRLVRRLCARCAIAQPEERDARTARLERMFGVRQQQQAIGCRECGETGYRGRVPVTEVLISTPELQERIARGASAAELHRTAERGGMRSIRESALTRVRAGETTLVEVERVLGEGDATPLPESAPAAVVPPRVLVVDDDPVMRELAVGLLRSSGYTVEVAIDGQAALDRLERDTDFALVTLDLSMPRLDGVDVLRRLRGAVATAGVPVIVLTGADDEASEVRLMNEGADDYLRKPLDPARFVARVRAVLRRAAA